MISGIQHETYDRMTEAVVGVLSLTTKIAGLRDGKPVGSVASVVPSGKPNPYKCRLTKNLVRTSVVRRTLALHLFSVGISPADGAIR